MESWLYFIILGAVAGWLAGMIMKGKGFGWIGNIVVGVIGAVLGGWLFSFLGIAGGGLIVSLVTALVGAVILLFIVGKIAK